MHDFIPQLWPFRFGKTVSVCLAILTCSASLSYSQSQSKLEPASLVIVSACGTDNEMEANVFLDSAVVHQRGVTPNAENASVMRFGVQGRLLSDSLFALLRGLGGAMVLRCPNVEAVSCRFEARLAENRLQCTNCSSCNEDFDRMSLVTLQRFKGLLQRLNLFL
jgi:hypothetical protein